MILLIALIRHCRIACADRFVGMTDEPLGADGRHMLMKNAAKGMYPQASLVYSSGLARCVETAKLLYPEVPVALLHELRAPHYGNFEGKSRGELARNAEFIKWLSSAEVEAFPGGEAPYDIAARSTLAFRKICKEMADKGIEQVAAVSHGLVLEAILRRYCVPRSQYIDSEIPHSGGVLLRYNTETLSAKIVDKY